MKLPAYVVSCLGSALLGLLPLSADVVTDWNAAALDAIRNESTSPPLAARNLAIVHAAVYDAVTAIHRVYDPYLFRPNPPAGASIEAAVVGAAYQALAGLYPSQQALFDEVRERTLSGLPAGQSREDGFMFGQLVAFLVLAWRGSDGSSTTVPYIPGAEPGDWRRTPPFFRPPELPQWPNVIPFTMTNGAQFRPAGPPLLTSTQYTRDFNLTKEIGALSSATRTAEQTLIARFWSDFSFTVTPPGHWNQIAANVATNATNSNGVIDNARLFALLNLGMADAGIACWDAKYLYNFWRPVTAIHEAESDGNSDTESDPAWTPLLNTPPFPEYTSGHSTFSSMAATILGLFYGTDHVSFTVGSDTVAGVYRSYDSFEAAAEEIGLSRIYGGIHFLSADLDGLAVGAQLGRYVFENFLRPTATEPELGIVPMGSNRWRIEVWGTSGRSYVLESSTDFTTWLPACTNAAPFVFEAQQSAATAHRFFRAVTLEDR